MSKKKKKTYDTKSLKKKGKDLNLGTIHGNDLLVSRKGKISLGLNPEIKGSVHKSKKDYIRNREKMRVRREIDSNSYFFIV